MYGGSGLAMGQNSFLVGLTLDDFNLGAQPRPSQSEEKKGRVNSIQEEEKKSRRDGKFLVLAPRIRMTRKGSKVNATATTSSWDHRYSNESSVDDDESSSPTLPIFSTEFPTNQFPPSPKLNPVGTPNLPENHQLETPWQCTDRRSNVFSVDGESETSREHQSKLCDDAGSPVKRGMVAPPRPTINTGTSHAHGQHRAHPSMSSGSDSYSSSELSDFALSLDTSATSSDAPSSSTSLESMTFRSVNSLSPNESEKIIHFAQSRRSAERQVTFEEPPELSRRSSFIDDNSIAVPIEKPQERRRRSWTVNSKETRFFGVGEHLQSGPSLRNKSSLPLLSSSRIPGLDGSPGHTAIFHPPPPPKSATFKDCIDDAYYRQFNADQETSSSFTITGGQRIGGLPMTNPLRAVKFKRFFKSHRPQLSLTGTSKFSFPKAPATPLLPSRAEDHDRCHPAWRFVEDLPSIPSDHEEDNEADVSEDHKSISTSHSRSHSHSNSSSFDGGERTVDEWTETELQIAMDKLRRLK